MTAFEKPVSASVISQMTGRAMSSAAVRAACWRAPDMHPLPHVRSGEKRPIILIRPSVFEQWYREEEAFTVGAMDGGAGKGSA